MNPVREAAAFDDVGAHQNVEIDVAPEDAPASRIPMLRGELRRRLNGELGPDRVRRPRFSPRSWRTASAAIAAGRERERLSRGQLLQKNRGSAKKVLDRFSERSCEFSLFATTVSPEPTVVISALRSYASR
jgi:hypothetical protein